MNSQDGNGIFACRPILCVENVVSSIDYYVGRLGFRLGWAWSDLEQRFLQHFDSAIPTFALVGYGEVQLMLAQQCQGAPGMWLHLDVQSSEQLDKLHEKWIQNGAHILEPPFVRAWGMYEARVTDLDGHVLRFSAPTRSNVESGAGS